MPKDTFEHQIVFIAVRIDIEIPNSTDISIGTGFLYKAKINDNTDSSITLLISNKHVFSDSKGTLKISLNKKDSEGNPDYGNVKPFIYRNFEHAYFEHPSNEVDLACVNVSRISHHDVYYRNLNDAFLKDIDYDFVPPSSEVIFVGYPENRFDVVNNLPLIRKGSIASVPDIDFNGKGQIVIDAQVFQGSSGSPVFVAIKNEYVLLGVVSETMIRHSRLQTLPATMPNIGVQQILGLGIVIKQVYVKELINHAVAEFLKRRKNS